VEQKTRTMIIEKWNKIMTTKGNTTMDRAKIEVKE
jgi:hypothetical protein